MGIWDDDVELDSLFAEPEAEVEEAPEPQPEPEPVAEKTLQEIAAEAAEKAERTGHIKDYRRAIKRAREAKAELDAEYSALTLEKRINEAASTLSRIQGFRGSPRGVATLFAKAYPDTETTANNLLAFARELELA